MANSVTFIGAIADKHFKDWQKSNENAFYLNVIGNFAMIHKADCPHLGEAVGMNSTANSKICSNDSEDLEKWATKNKKEFQICSDCQK